MASEPSKAAETGGLGGILGRMLAGGKVASATASLPQWEAFARTSDPGESLLRWIGIERAAAFMTPRGREAILREISRAVAALDRILSDQVNALIHHPSFQQLEATWRGVVYLHKQWLDWEEYASEFANEKGDAAKFRLRILPASKKELARDFDRMVEFDQSRLFRLVYEEEFGQPGGEPYGLVILDYAFTNHPDDVDMMAHVMAVGAAAFCPMMAAASPQLLGLQEYSVMEQPVNYATVFQAPEYIRWRALRDREDARFLGLTAPRILMREPYRDGDHSMPFRFFEKTSKPDRSECLWGSAAYAFGAVVIRSYFQNGWMADIRGFDRGHLSGGLATGLPVFDYHTDRPGVAIQCPVEVRLTEAQERSLCELGFLPICTNSNAEVCVFFSNPSVQRPKVYADPDATVNARISSMLQYMLCAGRFAHYLKVLARNKIGSQSEADALQTEFNRWVTNYVLVNDQADPDAKAARPLREANVKVVEIPEKPGCYRLVFHLQPHYQLDSVSASLRLATEVAGARR